MILFLSLLLDIELDQNIKELEICSSKKVLYIDEHRGTPLHIPFIIPVELRRCPRVTTVVLHQCCLAINEIDYQN